MYEPLPTYALNCKGIYKLLWGVRLTSLNSQKMKSPACTINFGTAVTCTNNFLEPDVFWKHNQEEEGELLMGNLVKLLGAFYDSSDDFNLCFNCDGGALKIQREVAG